jgi:simple sugar transport system ATP-binding protein
MGALMTLTSGKGDGAQMPRPLLDARGIVKRYGHVVALDGASFQVYPDEVVALIGDNGAGKSTLVKTLSGAIQPDEGTIALDGRTVTLGSPSDAQRRGIETVYQDLAVAPELDSAQNVYLGRELLHPGLLGALGFLDHKAMRRGAADAFVRLGTTVRDVSVPVSCLSGGQRQAVAVVRSVMFASKMILMDEPTAALGVVQRQNVLDLIRRVRDAGISVVLISHNMPEVLEVADRIEVLRLGRRVAVLRRDDATVGDLVGAMTGALS